MKKSSIKALAAPVLLSVITLTILIMLLIAELRAEAAAIQTEREGFAYDLEYLIRSVEDNFALFDVAYWARGVDINYLANNAREAFANTEGRITADMFFDMLRYYFAPLTGIGHFAIVTPASFSEVMGFIGVAPFIDLPHVRAFYNPRIRREENMLNRLRYALHGLEDEREIVYALEDFGWSRHRIDFTVTRARARGERLHEFIIRTVIRDINLQAETVYTEIIEDGRIAYMHIRRMGRAGNHRDNWPGTRRHWLEYQEQIFSFYEEICGFEHLIVDLRGNPGGFAEFFTEFVLAPNTLFTHNVRGYAFFTDGELPARFAKPPLYQLPLVGTNYRPSIFPIAANTHTVPTMLERFYMPELITDDMERMSYGFPIVHTIRPGWRFGQTIDRFGVRPAFEGRMWLLTDEHMASAAQIAAWAAKESGMFTLVGDITGGVWGGPRSYIPLPNSGIVFQMDTFYITDSRGRPLEAGTIPHYFNRPGLDALETVLEMINGDEPVVSDSIAGFSRELFLRVLDTEEPNIVISPLSAYYALAMAALGAGGVTFDEFTHILGGNPHAIAPKLAELTANLTDVSGSTVLNLAGSVWISDDFTVNTDFNESMKRYFNAPAASRNFADPATVDEINAWIYGQTNGLIPEMIDEIEPDEMMFLINTLYLLMRWAEWINPMTESVRTFTPASGAARDAAFLSTDITALDIRVTETYEAALLPYDDERTGFLIVRPVDGTPVRDFAAKICLGEVLANLSPHWPALLHMPELDKEFDIVMNEMLQDMGLVSAFTPQADLFGLVEYLPPSYWLEISTVRQAVRIIVDKEGTEAAAATVIGVEALTAAITPLILNFNTPYIYAVIDLETGIPLFMGVVDYP